MVSEKKMINEIVDNDDDEHNKDDDEDVSDGRRIIPIALGLSVGGLKTVLIWHIKEGPWSIRVHIIFVISKIRTGQWNVALSFS